MFARCQREGGRRRAGWLAPGLLALGGLALGGLGACFQVEALAYAPCDEPDACAEAGLLGCLRVPAAPAVRGLCTLACEDDEACPPGPEDAGAPRCAEVDGEQLCVLSCMDDGTCPEGHVCTEVAAVGEGPTRLCFAEARP